jgi:hypothetical protein
MRMQRLFAISVTCLLALVGTALPKAQSDNVSGDWDVTLNTQMGITKWQATFVQEGEQLTGEIDIGDRMILPLEGTVKENAVQFVFVVPDLDGDQPISMAGQFDGTSIKGKGSFVWFGDGEWMAERQ